MQKLPSCDNVTLTVSLKLLTAHFPHQSPSSFVCAHACAQVCIHMEARGVLCNESLSYSLRWWFSLNLELTDWARLAGQGAPRLWFSRTEIVSMHCCS